MGFFAVVQEQDQPLEVKVCHLNLWSLAGLGRRAFFCDVGLHLKAPPDQDLLRFHLALPFSTQDKHMEDLSAAMRNPSVAELVFGTNAEVAGNKITYDSQDGRVTLVLEQVAKQESTYEKKRSGATFSYWIMQLSQKIPAGEERYIRVRFEVYNLGRTWIWKSFKSGAIIDLRVADIRETISIPLWDDIGPRISEIKELYLFVIAPSWLQHASSSPQLKYMRILEGRVWESYLKRKTDFLRLEKMVIYYWHRAAEVNTVSPFRAFLDLNKTNVTSAAGTLALTVIAVFVTALLADVFSAHPQSIASLLLVIKSYVKEHSEPISVAGIVALMKLANDKYRLITRTIPTLIKAAYAVERLLYRVWQDP